MSRNCWEVMGCERYPGGMNVDEHGPCPATTIVVATGINNGLYGGRACWAIDGTLCDAHLAGSFLQDKETCRSCIFYAQVMAEENGNFMETEEIREEINAYKLF